MYDKKNLIIVDKKMIKKNYFSALATALNPEQQLLYLDLNLLIEECQIW